MKSKSKILILTLATLIIFQFYFYKDGWLFEFFRSDNRSISKVFIAIGADINKPNSLGNHLICYAVSSEKVEKVQFLLDRNVNLNIESCFSGSTLLSIADKNLEMVKLLVENGVEYKKDKWGYTSLHWAVFGGHTDVAIYLFNKFGIAESERKHIEGDAIHKQNLELVKFLEKNGIGLTSESLGALIHKETDEEKAIEILNYYEKKGIDVAGWNSCGKTHLMSAVMWHKNKLVDFIIAKGVDVNAVDPEGRTAMYLAKANRNKYAEVAIKKSAKENKALFFDKDKGIAVLNTNFLINGSKLEIPKKDKEELGKYGSFYEIDCKNNTICQKYGENKEYYDQCKSSKEYDLIFKYSCKHLEKLRETANSLKVKDEDLL